MMDGTTDRKRAASDSPRSGHRRLVRSSGAAADRTVMFGTLHHS